LAGVVLKDVLAAMISVERPLGDIATACFYAVGVQIETSIL
jgi:hypothetical protein